MLTGMNLRHYSGSSRRGLLLAGAAAWITRLDGQQTRDSLIDDVVTANHILAAQEIVDAFGHVSVRTAPGAGRYLISRSIAPAQVTAGAVIDVATRLGYPLSTTHVISGAVLGAGSTKSLSAVRWGIAGNIVTAWFLTIPAAALVAAAVYWPVEAIF